MSSDKISRIAIIGFGEAGGIFGTDLARADGPAIRAFDIKTDDPATADAMRARMETAGVIPCQTLDEALEGADLVLSLVTASAAADVARAVAPRLGPGQRFLDLNSVAPETKRRSAAVVEANGADYVDVAVMAPVPPRRLAVPLLLAGSAATGTADALGALGCNARAVSPDLGTASAIKMCRSIMIKGLEALTTTCVLTARHYGVEEPVLASLHASFPQMGWDDAQPHYLVSRVAEHGRRRASEMREVAKTVADAGQNPKMPAATAEIQDDLVDRMEAAGLAYADPFDWIALADALSKAEKA